MVPCGLLVCLIVFLLMAMKVADSSVPQAQKDCTSFALSFTHVDTIHHKYFFIKVVPDGRDSSLNIWSIHVLSVEMRWGLSVRNKRGRQPFI